ncbi:MAG: hypothetical protein QW667_02465 [Candidatus Bathyarchaeia archaeon]
MKTLEKVYWLRFALGIVAAIICVGYGIAAGKISSSEFDIRTFMNSLSIALIVYLISYYAIKSKFFLRVDNPQKLVTAGIGIYFLAWIVFWVLLYTIIAGPPLQSQFFIHQENFQLWLDFP